MTKYLIDNEVIMKIGIIGGGSIGLLFAHYLSVEHDVTLYVRSKEQEEKLTSDGLIFEKKNKFMKRKLQTLLFSQWTGKEDLTIIAVKQYHLHNIIEAIKQATFNHSCSLLFIQNGMGHIKRLKEFEGVNILVGTVEHGAYKVSANHVIHTGEGRTKVALLKGKYSPELKDLINSQINDFPFCYEEDYSEMLIQKLIINAVINPLTAILNVKNGELIHNPHYYRVFKELFAEISVVLNIHNKEKALEQLEEVCRKTAENRSSMLKDIDEKRPTEVDAILGYVLEQSREKGMNTPLTNGLYFLIKGKEYAEGGN